ncbi:MAG TPA: ATPase, T2SS/T4P/T4SS family [bacterium]|nr:ATPase, T2SS/T4P/T4SS family [bacterium]
MLDVYRHALHLTEGDVVLDAAVWFHTGLAARAAGRADGAMACFKKVIEVDPEQPLAYWELVDLYIQQQLEPAAVVVLSALGERMAGRGLWLGAVAALKRASELAPDDVDVLKSLRDAYGYAGKSNEAAAVQSLLQTLKPGTPAAADPVAAPAPTHEKDLGPPAGRTGPPPSRPVEPPQLFDPPAATKSGGPRKPAPSGAPHALPSRVRSVEGGKGRKAREPLLGEICVAHGWVTDEQVRKAADIQRQSNARLGRILVEMGAITEQQLSQGLAEQWGLRYTDLADMSVDSEIARLIPSYLARRHGVVAIGRDGSRLVVAMSDPSNVVAIDDIRLLTGLEVDVVISSSADIDRAQGQVYGGGGEIEEILTRTGLEPEITDVERADETNLENLRTAVEEAPIIRAVNQILSQAIQSGASDIHIEPQRTEVKVRLRIDGVLLDLMNPPKSVQAPLISRIKILADMDIAERRLPQDGHIHLRAEGKEYDMRVSTLPTVLGEKVVLRILDQSSTKVALHDIGFAHSILETWEGLITKPYGFILVTGPTGSGKTTTLYTSLARINTAERNIVSVENPVEYQIPRVNQVQVNPKVGLTFASGLRTILRQDPDVVLIGEIRDRETAEIAVQASMTGHLVLSTIHTNDAPGAVVRLRDMGIEPFLITSSLIGVLAQRLVRVICSKCKEAYVPPADALKRLGVDAERAEDVQLFRGRGCEVCRKTGYKGRIGVFELMVMTDRLRALAVGGAATEQLRDGAIEEGMRTLKQDAIRKVLEGVTTFEEMLRVVFVSESM